MLIVLLLPSGCCLKKFELILEIEDVSAPDLSNFLSFFFVLKIEYRGLSYIPRPFYFEMGSCQVAQADLNCDSFSSAF